MGKTRRQGSRERGAAGQLRCGCAPSNRFYLGSKAIQGMGLRHGPANWGTYRVAADGSGVLCCSILQPPAGLAARGGKCSWPCCGCCERCGQLSTSMPLCSPLASRVESQLHQGGRAAKQGSRKWVRQWRQAKQGRRGFVCAPAAMQRAAQLAQQQAVPSLIMCNALTRC